VAPALYADGPEKYSGKEKEVMQPAPPVCEFYRAHEWNFSIWGAWAFASDTGQNDFDTSRDSSGELINDPFTPDIDPFTQPLLFHPLRVEATKPERAGECWSD
jgi:hypothetical protein